MRAAGILSLGLWFAAGLAPASAEGPWSGTWETRWRGGGARLVLEQTGDRIEGTYPLYGGKVTGTVDGREFDGRWIEGQRSGGFVFALAANGNSFMGRYDSGEWWTGTRVTGTLAAGITVDQKSPRDAFRTFVVAGNLARRGQLDELGKALEVLEFGAGDANLLIGQKLDRARELFALVDETTFRIWSLPENAPEKAEVSVTLAQSGTDVPLPLTFRRATDGKWRLAMPAAEALAEHEKRLLARHGGKPPPPDEHLKLRHPRAALQTFLEGMAAWNTGGRAQTAGTLDLSSVSEAVRAHEGELAAEYLKQILDRVSFFSLQELPDDASSREPYVLFEHPAGRVVLAPKGDGAEARWLFTPETIGTLRPLYAALENMPAAADESMAGRPAPSSFFVIRRHIGAAWPALLKPMGSIEIWQALAILLLAIAGSAIAWFLSPLVTRAVGRPLWTGDRAPPGPNQDHDARRSRRDQAGRFVWPLRFLLAALVWYLGARVLGLPDLVQQVLNGAIALFAAIGGVWAGLLVIDIVGAAYHRRAERTYSNFDDMLVSFITGAAKLGLVILGAVYIADSLGIPWQGIIAGLGIGGLAVAFASRETLSNIFGAGILLIDRPFRRGDWIGTADNTQGMVEHVGIRSTRIRTPYGTLVVVPNGKLVDATINNYGVRRERLLRCNLAISYATRPEQLESFVAALGNLHEAHPSLAKGRTQAGVWQLTESAIDVEFVGTISAVSMAEERMARQALLLDIVRLAEHHDVTFRGAESPAGEIAEALNAGRPKPIAAE